MGKYRWDWLLIAAAIVLILGFVLHSIGRCEGACLDAPTPTHPSNPP